MWVLLYRFATRAHLCLFLLLLPTTGMHLRSFWQVQVPYPKSQFQRLRVVHWAAQYVSIPMFSLNPPYISKYSSFTSFVSASLPLLVSFLVLLSCTPKLLYGQYLFLIASYIPPYFLSTTLFHLIRARPFVTFSHTALSAIAANLSLGMFLT